MSRENLPVILTDIDGVAIQWQSGLPYFAQKYNLPLEHILSVIIEDKFIPPAEIFDCHKDLADKLIKKYNSSDFIRYLAPYADSLAVINKLKSKYRFVAVTALGTDVDSLLNRKFNLQALFPGAFEDIFVCGHDESKSVLFRKAKEKYGSDIVAYIDDMPHHVEAAHEELDCPIFWMPRGPRDNPPDCPHKKVRDWNDLEWAIDMSTPVIRQETINKDKFTWEEILKQFDKCPKVPTLLPERGIDDAWRFPTPICDFPQPLTPYSDPVFPGVGTGTPRIWPNRPQTGDIPDWLKWPKVTTGSSSNALLGMSSKDFIEKFGDDFDFLTLKAANDDSNSL